MDRVLTPDELAARYGVSPLTLADWRYKSTGPRYFQAGKRVFYRESEVEAWEKARTEKASA